MVKHHLFKVGNVSSKLTEGIIEDEMIHSSTVRKSKLELAYTWIERHRFSETSLLVSSEFIEQANPEMFLPIYNLIGADAIPEAKNYTERGGKFLITNSGFSYRKKEKPCVGELQVVISVRNLTDVGKFGDTLTCSYSSIVMYLSKTFNIFGAIG